jgi:ribonuclease P protein component
MIKSQNLKILYIPGENDSESRMKVGFAISKQIKRKVDRNKIRRVLKEIFRLNKYYLFQKLEDSKKSITFLILFSNKNERIYDKINYKMLSMEFNQLLKEIIQKVL